MNYLVMTVPDADALIREVRGGQRTVSSLLERDQCNFTADFAGATAPNMTVSGDPGQTGFNISISGRANPAALPTNNPAHCLTISEVQVDIGGRSEALAVGGTTMLSNGLVRFANSWQFDESGFFQARLLSFDPATRRASGEFTFVNRILSEQRVLIVRGSFAMTP